MNMVAHTVNPSTWEARAGGPLWVQGLSGLNSEFYDIVIELHGKNLSQRKKKSQTKIFFLNSQQN